jgi:spore coat protein U-like protein
MTGWGRIGLAVAAALSLSASAARAQSAGIQAIANVYSAITVNGFRALDFGNVTPGLNKVIAPDAATSGRFDAAGQASTNVNISFALPAVLTSGGNNLPINTWTGCWDSDTDPSAGCTSFTPSGAASPAAFSGGGQLYVFVGATVAPAANQAAGPYAGTVTITVAYF